MGATVTGAGVAGAAVMGAGVEMRAMAAARAADVAAGPIAITNVGETAVDAVVTVSGAARTPEPAAANGFEIERSYYTLDGKPVDIGKGDSTDSEAAQSDRFVVVLKIVGRPQDAAPQGKPECVLGGEYDVERGTTCKVTCRSVAACPRATCRNDHED